VLTRGKEIVLVVFGYALLTCIFIYPIPFQISRSFTLQIGDQAQYLWNLWWANKAVMELHTNPYFTEYLFHPSGVSLTFHDFSPLNSFLSIPIQFFASSVEAFNVLLILNFVLSGLAAYLLVRYLTGSRLPAFIAGVYYAFNPAHTMNIYQLSQASIQWVPLACLYLIKTAREGKIQNVLLGAVFFGLTALSSWYQLVFLALFTILFVSFFAVFRRERILNKKFFFNLILLCIVTVGILSPVMVPMVRETLSGSSSLETMSNPSHPVDLLGLTRGGYYIFWPVFFGYASFLCVFFSRTWRDKEKTFWVVNFIFFFLIALGPQLHILGKSFPGIPMLKLFLDKMPFFSAARAQQRFLLMSFLSVAVLMGFSCQHIRHRFFLHKPRKGNLVLSLIGIIIVLEFVPPPKPSFGIDVPEIYYEIADDEGDYAVFELPIFRERASQINPEEFVNDVPFWGRYMFYQTIHGKTIFWGYISRITPHSSFEFLLNNRALDFLWIRLPEAEAELPAVDRDAFLDLMQSNNFRYIIAHRARIHPIASGKVKQTDLKGRKMLMDRIITSILPFSLNRKTNQGKFAGSSWKENNIEDIIAVLDDIFVEPVVRDKDIVVYQIEKKNK
jgi:hypothetical protein